MNGLGYINLYYNESSQSFKCKKLYLNNNKNKYNKMPLLYPFYIMLKKMSDNNTYDVSNNSTSNNLNTKNSTKYTNKINDNL